jgi:PAT family beta-lactamase induction signal transducer AmpG
MRPARGDLARTATNAAPWLSGVAFVADIARATNPADTATQFALFTSLAAVPRTFVNATTGWLVESLGWLNFFWLCAALAVPGMLLLLKVAPWGDGPPSPTGGTSGARP